MPTEVNRRLLLRSSLGGAAALGLVAAGAPSAAAAPPGRRDPGLPDVPGMRGDRRANEFWHVYDEKTYYDASQEVTDAYAAISAYTGPPFERTLREKWWELVKLPDYPANFTAFVEPIREPLELLSRVQLDVADTYYGNRHHELVRAYGWFGEGVLFDPRGHAPYLVHTMNTVGDEPPRAYHTWYVVLRAMMLLDIEPRRWELSARALGWAWALQTVAKPAQDKVNPPLPRATVARLAASWLPRGVERLDQDFQSFWLPEGMS
ncbi:hypothetical protein [Streptomyces sp. NPDC058665]|uniref:hypothetical protein n=1 Tax=Streptomyces sp. NPDC058665 TaxID=3346586 RepID=UPI003665479C